jgi:hypothetical protein
VGVVGVVAAVVEDVGEDGRGKGEAGWEGGHVVGAW